jgi:hypothetical protein
MPFALMLKANENGGFSPETIAIIQRLIDFTLRRVDTKPARTNRVAKLRVDLWLVLAELSEFYPVKAVLESARRISISEKHKEPERDGAIQYMLSLREEGDEATDHVISKLRDNPPNRDVLMAILSSDIDLGESDQFSALIALEDWDDED